MFHPDITQKQLAKQISHFSPEEFQRLLYCQRMASTFLAVHQFEHAVFQAMFMCDSIKVKAALGTSVAEWQLLKARELKGSTLGNLIRILERHGFAEEDIRYLGWLKDKRDYFVHRFFNQDEWPGNLDEENCRLMSRRLMAIEAWLSRGADRIWRIFEKAGLVDLEPINGGGMLVINADLRRFDGQPANEGKPS